MRILSAEEIGNAHQSSDHLTDSEKVDQISEMMQTPALLAAASMALHDICGAELDEHNTSEFLEKLMPLMAVMGMSMEIGYQAAMNTYDTNLLHNNT
jgi:hypothetical protein